MYFHILYVGDRRRYGGAEINSLNFDVLDLLGLGMSPIPFFSHIMYYNKRAVSSCTPTFFFLHPHNVMQRQ